MKSYIDVMDGYHIVLDRKELAKLDRISSEEGTIKREEFFEYAKKSAGVKEFVEKGGAYAGSKAGKISLDKAELAFKV